MSLVTADLLQVHGRRSKSRGRTTDLLRHVAFSIVDQALRAHYGTDYGDRCVQAALGVAKVLGLAGVETFFLHGTLSMPIRFDPASGPVIGGFWGDGGTHTWVVTEFKELVDLTISHFTKNPRRGYGASPPPFWLYRADLAPPGVQYVPDPPCPVELYMEDPADEADLAVFMTKLEEVIQQTLGHADSQDLLFDPILENPRTLARLLEQGHEWALLLHELAGLLVPPSVALLEGSEELSDVEGRSTG